MTAEQHIAWTFTPPTSPCSKKNPYFYSFTVSYLSNEYFIPWTRQKKYLSGSWSSFNSSYLLSLSLIAISSFKILLPEASWCFLVCVFSKFLHPCTLPLKYICALQKQGTRLPVLVYTYRHRRSNSFLKLLHVEASAFITSEENKCKHTRLASKSYEKDSCEGIIYKSQTHLQAYIFTWSTVNECLNTDNINYKC